MSKSEHISPHGTIVVAEDSAPNRAILVLLLKKFGFNIMEFESGDKAWQALDQNRDKKIIAVVSDLMMPGLNGLELASRVRNDPHYAQLPFVLVTAVSDRGHVMEAKELRINGYMLKPVTLSLVSKKLKDLFPDKKLPQLAG